MTKLALLVVLISACEHDPKYERDGQRPSPAAEPRPVDLTVEHPTERPLERSAPVDFVPTHTPPPAPKPKSPAKHRHRGH